MTRGLLHRFNPLINFCKVNNKLRCYYLIFNEHKWLSIKRKQSFKQDLIITFIIFIALIFLTICVLKFLYLFDFPMTDFIFPIILTTDFCLRFFFKSNQSVGILPYLCLPIKRQNLIAYILIADFLSGWIWGNLLVYLLILYQCDYFTPCNNPIIAWAILLATILCNNYMIYLIKAVLRGYSLLIFPVCLAVFIFTQFSFFNLHSMSVLVLSCIGLIFVVILLNKVLMHNLYKELNELAC